MKKKTIFLLPLVCLLLAALSVNASDSVPEAVEGAKTVDDGWVNENYQKIKIYDTRNKGEYAEGHIPGAISAPLSRGQAELSRFPEDKEKPLIVYCYGEHCSNSSYQTVKVLVDAGYKNVYWYRNGGFPGWKKKGYPVE